MSEAALEPVMTPKLAELMTELMANPPRVRPSQIWNPRNKSAPRSISEASCPMRINKGSTTRMTCDPDSPDRQLQLGKRGIHTQKGEIPQNTDQHQGHPYRHPKQNQQEEPSHPSKPSSIPVSVSIAFYSPFSGHSALKASCGQNHSARASNPINTPDRPIRQDSGHRGNARV